MFQEQRTIVIAKQLEINEVEHSLAASIKAVEVKHAFISFTKFHVICLLYAILHLCYLFVLESSILLALKIMLAGPTHATIAD
jgi:hypothetical protein